MRLLKILFAGLAVVVAVMFLVAFLSKKTADQHCDDVAWSDLATEGTIPAVDLGAAKKSFDLWKANNLLMSEAPEVREHQLDSLHKLLREHAIPERYVKRIASNVTRQGGKIRGIAGATTVALGAFGLLDAVEVAKQNLCGHAVKSGAASPGPTDLTLPTISRPTRQDAIGK
jgi:hypothetical protein